MATTDDESVTSSSEEEVEVTDYAAVMRRRLAQELAWGCEGKDIPDNVAAKTTSTKPKTKNKKTAPKKKEPEVVPTRDPSRPFVASLRNDGEYVRYTEEERNRPSNVKKPGQLQQSAMQRAQNGASHRSSDMAATPPPSGKQTRSDLSDDKAVEERRRREMLGDPEFALPPKSAPLDDLITKLEAAPSAPRVDIGNPQITSQDAPTATAATKPTSATMSLEDAMKQTPMSKEQREEIMFMKQMHDMMMDSVEVIEPSMYMNIAEQAASQTARDEAAEARFERCLRVLEEFVVNRAWEHQRSMFFVEHCPHFPLEDVAEHTHEEYDIYRVYCDQFESAILDKMQKKVRNFDEEEFFEMLLERSDELSDEAWELILSVRDFETFFDLMRDTRRDVHGTGSSKRVGKVQSLKALVRTDPKSCAAGSSVASAADSGTTTKATASVRPASGLPAIVTTTSTTVAPKPPTKRTPSASSNTSRNSAVSGASSLAGKRPAVVVNKSVLSRRQSGTK
eukprot:PhM_4_TR6169/c0_g1_i1/m.104902